MNERNPLQRTIGSMLGQQRPIGYNKYELSIHQGGDCIKLKLDDANMYEVLMAALKNDCGVHIQKLAKEE